MMVSNLEIVPGRRVVKHLGLVQGSTVRAKHVGKDLRMKQEARVRGARMIFNVKFQTFAIPSNRKDSGGAVEVLAYGTGLIRPI